MTPLAELVADVKREAREEALREALRAITAHVWARAPQLSLEVQQELADAIKSIERLLPQDDHLVRYKRVGSFVFPVLTPEGEHRLAAALAAPRPEHPDDIPDDESTS